MATFPKIEGMCGNTDENPIIRFLSDRDAAPLGHVRLDGGFAIEPWIDRKSGRLVLPVFQKGPSGYEACEIFVRASGSHRFDETITALAAHFDKPSA